MVTAKGFMSEFMDFLKEYKIIGLAIAFIMGVAATALVKSLVDNIIMPPIGMALGGINFTDFAFVLKAATETTPAVSIMYGAFIGEFINFLIIALVIFLMAKIVLKEEKVGKK
ncbi:MAG TPA: large conductance mechanosensitive channel protein MscL [archaeon]|nr:large conductance mechanosensitive channel protein MscL [archaeon]